MNKKASTKTCGFIYFFIHLFIEVACFYQLYFRFNVGGLFWIYAILFDAIAFLPQCLFGALFDKFKNVPFGVIGLIIMALSFINLGNVPSLLLLSLGNAIVHVDGAKHTLTNANGKIFYNALFVSGGALGVIAGKLLAKTGLTFIPLILLFISLILSYYVYKKHTLLEDEYIPFVPVKTFNGTFLVTVVVMFAVAVRTYLGYAIPISWNNSDLHAVLLFTALCLGKLLGGILADKFGYKITVFLSLIISIPFILVGDKIAVLSLIGIMLINLSMPITVGIICSAFPKNKAFAFGITTVGMFIGIIPVFFVSLDFYASIILVVVLSLIAYFCITLLLKGVKND